MADCRGINGGPHGGMDPRSLAGIILIVTSICSLVLDWEPIKTPDLTSLGFLGVFHMQKVVGFKVVRIHWQAQLRLSAQSVA